MDAILGVWPEAQVMSMYGPWLSTNLTHQHVPFMRDFAKENPVEGSFFVGWISALHKHLQRTQAQVQQQQQQQQQQQRSAGVSRAPLFLDGAENYGFGNLSDVIQMKQWLKFGMATTDLVPPSLKTAFPSLETVSPGVYDFPQEYHGRGPGTPAMWQGDLVASLRGMDADGLTWAYSEKYDWFGLGAPHTLKPLVPKAWLDATVAAKRLGQLPP